MVQQLASLDPEEIARKYSLGISEARLICAALPYYPHLRDGGTDSRNRGLAEKLSLSVRTVMCYIGALRKIPELGMSPRYRNPKVAKKIRNKEIEKAKPDLSAYHLLLALRTQDRKPTFYYVVKVFDHPTYAAIQSRHNGDTRFVPYSAAGNPLVPLQKIAAAAERRSQKLQVYCTFRTPWDLFEYSKRLFS